MTAPIPPDPWHLGDRVDRIERQLADAVAEIERLRAAVPIADGYVSATQAAALVGRSAGAWKRLRQRYPAIDAASIGHGKARRWRRSTIVELVESGAFARGGAA